MAYEMINEEGYHETKSIVSLLRYLEVRRETM